MSNINVGSLVSFGRPNGEKSVGRVVKVNRSTVMVELVEERGAGRGAAVGSKWRVHLSLVSPVDASGAVSAPVMAPEVQARLKAGQDRDYDFLRGGPKVKRADEAIIRDIQDVYCGLSPENLHCDGEISRSAAARKYRSLMAQLKNLFRELGREISEHEAFQAVKFERRAYQGGAR